MSFKSISWINRDEPKIENFISILVVVLSIIIVILGLYFYMGSSADSVSNPKSYEYRSRIVSKLKKKSNRYRIKKRVKDHYKKIINQLKNNTIKRKKCQKLIERYLNVSNIMKKTLSNGFIGITILYFIFYVPLILFVMSIEFNMRINLLHVFNLLLGQGISALAIYSITINLSSVMSESLTFGRHLSIFIPIIGYTVFMLQVLIKGIIWNKHSFTYEWIPPVLHR